MSNSPSRRVLVVAVAALLALAACGSSDETDAGPVAEDGMACFPIAAEPTTEAPDVGPIAEAPEEVEQDDLVVGDGCPFGSFPYSNVNLIGAKADGTVFTDSWADGRPLSIDPNRGELLPALAAALADLEVGGIREVVLPAADAYGAEGFEAQGIGPDEALTFVVELFSVSDGPEFCREASLPEGTRPGKPETIEMPVEAPTELETEDLTVGTGDAVENGNFVKIEYTGVACSTGAEFDSSYNRDATFDFTVGEGAIQGMSDGVVGAQKGGVRRIVIPADQGYGASGQGDIGPNEPLVFVVTITDVLESDPALATTTTAAGATTTTAAP